MREPGMLDSGPPSCPYSRSTWKYGILGSWGAGRGLEALGSDAYPLAKPQPSTNDVAAKNKNGKPNRMFS